MNAPTASPANTQEVSARCRRAQALLARGDLAGAATLAEELLRKAPKNVETLLLAVDVNVAARQVDNARAILQVALLLDGEGAEVWKRAAAVGGAFPKNPLPFSRITESKSFFHQRLVVRSVASRKPFFVDRLRGKRVLHVGCVDHPIFQPETNLHIHLERHMGSGELHGCDTAEGGIAELQAHVKGPIFCGLDDVLARGEPYDAVLVPEVLEHVPNQHDFLTRLFRVPAKEFVITGPNFKPNFAQSAYKDDVFEELVHPDHKCYFSPYTLLYSVLPFVDREADGLELFLLENHHSVCVCVHRAG